MGFGWRRFTSRGKGKRRKPQAVIGEIRLTARQIAFIASDKFLESPHYKRWSYDAKEKYDARCMCCGRTPQQHGIFINSDHIKPRKLYPLLCLEPSNAQILCGADCNAGKGNRSERDWRSNPKPIVLSERGKSDLLWLLKWIRDNRVNG